jgi:hypothetical protein
VSQPSESEYPSEEQIGETSGALKSEEDQKMREVLPKREQEKESVSLPDYPPHEQIEQSWEAYRKSGQQGILEFLQKQRAERNRQRKD